MFHTILSLRRFHPSEVAKFRQPTPDSGLRTSDSPSPAPGGRRAAFTLIELLVVVTIMATLLALLGGGIRKSIDNARRRRAATEREAVRTAILNFWHDEGKPPIETKKGFHTYIFCANRPDLKSGEKWDDDWTKVINPLLDPEHELNNLKKAYLSEKDVNTGKEPSITKIKIDLSAKNATVE